MENKIINVQDGQTFEIAGIEFIKFPAIAEGVPVVTRGLQKVMCFGQNNDLRSSDVLAWLKETFLPKIAETIGEDNLVRFKTDLTTLDGLTPYGTMESLISLPTLDFYRANVSIFDKYKPDCWWWLATPESAQPHDDPYWVKCVAPSGNIYDDYYLNVSGVRPFCVFKSSIFESSEN